jgi:YVTN family beta-propeller protein
MRRRSDTRVLAAVLFTDIVDSSAVASRVGDARWKELIGRHHAIVRRELKRFGGRELDTAGDGFFASFAEPAAAIRCACAAAESVRDLGIEIRAGVHFGECEQVGGKLGGIAVVVGARVMSLGGAGDVLATATTGDLVAGAGFGFQDRGAHSLKGVDGEWRVLAVSEVDGEPRARPAEPEEAARRLAEIQPATLRPRTWRTSTRWAAGIAVALVVALIAIAIPAIRSDDIGLADVTTNSIARMNENGSAEVAAELGQRPGASAVGFGSLWVLEPDRGRVARLDLADGSVTDTIKVGSSPAGVTIGDDSVWVTNSGDGTVSRVNVDTNEETQVLDAGTGPTGIAYGDGALWVADTLGAELLRIDPVTSDVKAVGVSGQPSSVAFTGDGVWVSMVPAGISRVDPSDLSVTFTKTVGNGPTAVLSAFDSIWVANHLDGTVTRLDPSTGGVRATIPVAAGPNALASAGDSMWVANEFADSITALDVTTDTVRETIPVGGAAASLAADGDTLWLAVGASATAHRGGTLTVASTGEVPSSLDPATTFNDDVAGGILSLANDGLLTFRKVAGADGATLVPDLAAALPEVSPDGLTYRFVLREGLRYSTGEPIRAEDFRYALERSVAVGPDVAPYLFQALEGMDVCAEDPPACDLSRAVVVDEGSVTFHLSAPDPDLPFKLAQPPAYPLPSTVPIEDQGFEAVPATGPYMVGGASRLDITLVRNPGFDEWSPAAQPDGFVDEISWRFNQDPADAFDAVAAGASDLLTGDVRSEDLAALEAVHPDRIVRWPNPQAWYLGFDMRVPPFDDPRVRQALNYAIDRDRVVELAGGPNVYRVACQIFPPNIQGYEPFCPYTIGPESGVWSAPDVDRAKALIEQAGAAGAEPTVWTSDFGGSLPGAAVMRYIDGVLEELGMHPRLEVIDDVEKYFGGVADGRPNLYFGGWIGTFTGGGGGWIDHDFRCGNAGSAPVMCTKQLDTAIGEAQQLQITDPAAANDAWTEIEHGLVEDAVWAPLTNGVSTFVVSERLGNVQVHAQWGILLSRAWVR